MITAFTSLASHTLRSAKGVACETKRSHVFILQTQQLYTAGIPLLEAYLLPNPANNRTRNERLSADSHAVQIHTHARFPRSKKNGRLIM